MSDFDDNEDYQEDIEQVEDDEVIEDEQDIDDSQDDEQEDDSESDDSEDDDALDFSFDDDGDSEDKDLWVGQKAPPWIKDTRNENRELKRQLRELQKQQGQPEQRALREKPTLDAHEYDSDAYEQDYAAWLSEKSQHDAQVQAEQQKYKQYHDRYKADVDAVKAKAPDYDEIELSVVDVLSEQKQGLLQMLTDNPAKVVYALGKNSPAQLERLSKLDDVQFTKQIVLMEQQMTSKSKSRNSNKPKPKTHELEGAAGGSDTRLAKLEAEADRTGNRSAVVAYKRSQRK